MGIVLEPLDWILLLGTLALAMAVGLVAARKDETSEDYFLASKSIRWWGVAGSIFGSNVSANHLVGMMGLGFSVGFAQSHFELGAIAGLMMLCYGFLPVYRRLNVYTLSEYLEQRYDARSRIAYAAIMVTIMAIVQMAPALYIGARSMCVLLGGDAVRHVNVESLTPGAPQNRPPQSDMANVQEPAVSRAAPGEISRNTNETRLHVNLTYYNSLVIILAAVSASYTILGGLKAVVWTDVIQSVLLLGAGLLLAFLAYQAIGGWSAMVARDMAGAHRMRLYLPSDDKDLPWTGVLTGLMALHLFYWGTNQFIVQRALAARSDREARLGIVAAGFLKMLIPFFSIGVGIAAIYLFQDRLPGRHVDPDTVFPHLVRLLVPAGFGLAGLIMAGVLGAILSSIDSMMNSSATIITMDVYKRYLRPGATERRLVLIGRASIVVMVVLATLLAIFALDPNSEDNFFLQIADYQGYLVPGVLVTFLLGMFWRRGTPAAGFASIVSGILYSGFIVYLYNDHLVEYPSIRAHLGTEINFFHRVVGVIILCVLTYVGVSLMGRTDERKQRLTWTDLGGHDPRAVRRLAAAILLSLAIYAALAGSMVSDWMRPATAGWLGGLWTLAMFVASAIASSKWAATRAAETRIAEPPMPLWLDDRCWAGLLCAVAVYMMFAFY